MTWQQKNFLNPYSTWILIIDQKSRRCDFHIKYKVVIAVNNIFFLEILSITMFSKRGDFIMCNLIYSLETYNFLPKTHCKGDKKFPVLKNVRK